MTAVPALINPPIIVPNIPNLLPISNAASPALPTAVPYFVTPSSFFNKASPNAIAVLVTPLTALPMADFNAVVLSSNSSCASVNASVTCLF